MKQPIELKTACFGTLLAIAASSNSLMAADQAEVQWQQVCQVTHGHELQVTTATGEKVTGYCVSIDVNQMTLSTSDHKLIKVAKATLAHLEMERSKGHQVAALRRGVHKGLADGVNNLLSPQAIGGLVLIPTTIAWGAVSLPFCLLGDLKSKLSGNREIKPI